MAYPEAIGFYRYAITVDMDKEQLSTILKDGSEQYLDDIWEMVNAPFFAMNGMEAVSVTPKEVTVRKTIVDRDINSNGFWHGGTIYGVMDHTFAILVNQGCHAVGQSSNINYFRPGRGSEITCKAKFINVSRSLFHVYVEAFDGEKMVASGTFVAFRLQEIHS